MTYNFLSKMPICSLKSQSDDMSASGCKDIMAFPAILFLKVCMNHLVFHSLYKSLTPFTEVAVKRSMVKFTFLGIVRECSAQASFLISGIYIFNLHKYNFIITLLGNLSKNDYLVSDLEPQRVTQFSLPVVGQSLLTGAGISQCWM